MKITPFIKIIIAGILCLNAINLYSEVAILPYKVDNPSVYLLEKSGIEYSKLLTVAAIIAKKDIELTAPRDIEADIERMKMSTQGVITQEELDLFGRTRQIDYILLGTLSRAQGKYFSKSVLYSVHDKRVILKISVSAKSLFKLAEREIDEAFLQYEKNDDNEKSNSKKKANLDVAFVLDMSYKISKDWALIQNAIVDFSSHAIDSMGIKTRTYLIPFSDRISYDKASVSTNSIITVQKDLEKLKPVGAASSDNFLKAMKYAVLNIRWRYNANKIIIIISNSNVNKAEFAEKHALTAGKKGISIFSVSLGELTKKESILLERLSEITKGFHVNVAYHQRLFDADATPVDLYMEKGRLFQSKFKNAEWKNGLFDNALSQPYYGKPKQLFDEIFFDEGKHRINPYNMSKMYQKIGSQNIINQHELESNISSVLKKIFKSYAKKGPSGGKTVGKVLISDGKISFWAYVNKDYMDYFEKMHKHKYFFYLGIVIRKNSQKTYGLNFIPKVKDLSSDHLPDNIKTTLSDIIKKKEYYLSTGLFYPPVWFINVKVEEVERFKKVRDIRN